MKTICVKSLLLMTAYIFTVHASDKQTLLFTQDEYFKMSTETLNKVKKGLEVSIQETKKEAEERVDCGCNDEVAGIAMIPLVYMTSICALAATDPVGPERRQPSILLMPLGVLSSLAAVFGVQECYPWWATRHQRRELSKVKLALLKKLGEDEKQD